MEGPALFLHAFAKAVAAMALYGEEHPARERAVDVAYEALLELQGSDPRPLFTFLEDEVIYGQDPVPELGGWAWARRLAGAGIQRLEFQAPVEREDFEGFLEEVFARLNVSFLETRAARQMRATRIRFGAVGIQGEPPRGPGDGAATATLSFTLKEEAETVRWLHGEVDRRGRIPLTEAEAVVASLTVAMHGDQELLLPLLQLRRFDEYTTTHALNVSVLAMALAEHLGHRGREVRAFGVAGLLHDIGKIRIPKEILTKPGRLDEAERAVMNSHTVEGARLILSGEEELDLAAVVAYEHHIMLDGGGYPRLRYPRRCHAASRLVHVCDVYDALRTNRPYREAWPMEKVLGYMEERAGKEFDPRYALPFVEMMRRWEGRVALVQGEEASLPLGASPAGETGPGKEAGA